MLHGAGHSPGPAGSFLPLEGAVTSQLTALALDEPSQRLFVTDSGGGRLLAIDLLGRPSPAPLLVPGAGPLVHDPYREILWLGGTGAPGLLEVDPTTLRTLARHEVPGTPRLMEVDPVTGWLAVVTDAPKALVLFDPYADVVRQEMPLTDLPTGLAAGRGRGRLYLAQGPSGSVSVLDGQMGTPVGNFTLGEGALEALAMSSDGHHLWAGTSTGRVLDLDPGSGTPVRRWELGAGVGALAPTRHRVSAWVSLPGEGVALEIDPAREGDFERQRTEVGARVLLADPSRDLVYVLCPQSRGVAVLRSRPGTA